MLSKMAQPNNGGGTAAGGSAAGGRRVPLSLSGASAGGAMAGTKVSQLQQAAGNGTGRSSPQNSNPGKKSDSIPVVSLKKLNHPQAKQAGTSQSTATINVDDEKKEKNLNGANKSTNGNHKTSQNGSSVAVAKEQQKTKEKQAEVKETEANVEAKIIKKAQDEATIADKQQKDKVAEPETIDLCNDVPKVQTTPTSERKSSRRQQKTPSKVEQQTESSPVQKKSEKAHEPSAAVAPPPAPAPVPPPAVAQTTEDVDMETLAVDASPIRSSQQEQQTVQPAATSTPGRNLFGFRSSSKQTTEVELAAKSSNSPITTPARTFAQISGRRSIRPISELTPGKLGNYRCINNSDLDTSNCTNTSMNATVGSEIPNSSSFSFSFFGRGRKRERTPPVPLSGSQSTNDLAQDVEMSPPKRARFELFSLNLASPFSLLRSRFSKATISSPSSRQKYEDAPPAGDVEEVGDVQNVSGIAIQDDEELDKSSASAEVTVGQEAGLETPKKAGTPVKEDVEKEKDENNSNDKDASASDPSITDTVEVEASTEGEGGDRSRCAIM